MSFLSSFNCPIYFFINPVDYQLSYSTSELLDVFDFLVILPLVGLMELSELNSSQLLC